MAFNYGIYKYDNIEWTRYSQSDGLVTHSIVDMAIDMEENIWVAHNKGASKLLASSLDIINNNYPEKPFCLISKSSTNPISKVSIISFKIPIRQYVELNLYDIRGRILKKLYSKNTNAGEYSIKFDMSNFSSGFYFYSLRTEKNGTLSRKIMLLK